MPREGSALKCFHRRQPYGGATRARPVLLNTGGRVNRSDVLGGIVHEYERAA